MVLFFQVIDILAISTLSRFGGHRYSALDLLLIGLHLLYKLSAPFKFFFGVPHRREAIHGSFRHIHRICTSTCLGQYVLNADKLNHCPNRTSGNYTGARRRRL